MGRGGKDRPCSPPRHQGRQGKENIKLFIFIPFAALVRKRDRAPGVKFRCRAVTAHLFFYPLRSSAPSAFRISTRRRQWDAEEKIDPVHHQDTKDAKEKRTLCGPLRPLRFEFQRGGLKGTQTGT